MQPDARLVMRTALALGPDYCPPDLFTGSIASTVRGLKAHANTISHARHVALEGTYPRTRTLIGARIFHQLAREHLADATVLRSPLAQIGNGFATRLVGAARDLARVEWAWLEAHGEYDAAPFDLAAIAGLDPQAVAAARVALHPSTRLVAVGEPARLQWDGTTIRATHVLVTRPYAEVIVTSADRSVATFFKLLRRPRTLGDLLERNAAATTTLVTAGALTPSAEVLL
jgi:hypothetical protein